MKLNRTRTLLVLTVAAISVASDRSDCARKSGFQREGLCRRRRQRPDQVLEWNQIFIETLIATNTPNS